MYRVWIQQINADMIDVSAQSEEEAKAKAIRQWRRDTADPVIDDVVKLSEARKEFSDDTERTTPSLDRSVPAFTGDRPNGISGIGGVLGAAER
jgi:hypothetical protein